MPSVFLDDPPIMPVGGNVAHVQFRRTGHYSNTGANCPEQAGRAFGRWRLIGGAAAHLLPGWLVTGHIPTD